MVTRSVRSHLRRAVVALVAACALAMPAGAEQAREKLGFRLDWTIYGTHAPFFLALERGYYAEEGIDLRISEGQGSATVAKLIAQGSDPLGFVDFGTMAKGVVQGLPLKAVLGINQSSPMIIISHADNPIRTPQDLVGKVIAMAPAESTAQVFPALLAAAGIEANKISVVNPAVGAKNALFLQRRADAMPGYVNVQVAQLEAQGARLVYMRYADFGVNTLSNGIVANTQFLAGNGALVRRFLRATARGWAEAQKDPAAAVEAVLKRYSHLRDQKSVLLRQLELSFPTLQTPNTRAKPFGWMSVEDWRQTQQILLKYAGLEKEVPPETYFTNEYVP